MNKWGFVIKARSDAAMARYKELHRAVPDEVAGATGALAEIGVQRMTIMCWPPRTLFMLVEADPSFDPVRDFGRAVQLHPVVQAWDDQMHGDDPLLERVDGNNTDLNWFRLDQVFAWERPEPVAAPDQAETDHVGA